MRPLTRRDTQPSARALATNPLRCDANVIGLYHGLESQERSAPISDLAVPLARAVPGWAWIVVNAATLACERPRVLAGPRRRDPFSSNPKAGPAVTTTPLLAPNHHKSGSVLRLGLAGSRSGRCAARELIDVVSESWILCSPLTSCHAPAGAVESPPSQEPYAARCRRDPRPEPARHRPALEAL